MDVETLLLFVSFVVRCCSLLFVVVVDIERREREKLGDEQY